MKFKIWGASILFEWIHLHNLEHENTHTEKERTKYVMPL